MYALSSKESPILSTRTRTSKSAVCCFSSLCCLLAPIPKWLPHHTSSTHLISCDTISVCSFVCSFRRAPSPPPPLSRSKINGERPKTGNSKDFVSLLFFSFLALLFFRPCPFRFTHALLPPSLPPSLSSFPLLSIVVDDIDVIAVLMCACVCAYLRERHVYTPSNTPFLFSSRGRGKSPSTCLRAPWRRSILCVCVCVCDICGSRSHG